MDKIAVITSFLFSIIAINIPLLYGTVGEILVEKSGSLNLGVEGIMAMGAIFGYLFGCYANSLLVGVLSAFLVAAVCGLLFALLTVTLQANQNITGLTLTTFCLGIYFFVGTSICSSGAWPVMSKYAAINNGYNQAVKIPFLCDIPVVGKALFSHNILVYLGILIAVGVLVGVLGQKQNIEWAYYVAIGIWAVAMACSYKFTKERNDIVIENELKRKAEREKQKEQKKEEK